MIWLERRISIDFIVDDKKLMGKADRTGRSDREKISPVYLFFH